MVIFSRDEAFVEMLVKNSSRKLKQVHDLHELNALLGERLDAVLIDCDDHSEGVAALKAVAGSDANRQSPCVAITDGETAHADAKDFGGWIVLEKTSLWKQPNQIERWLGAVPKRQHYRFALKSRGQADSGALMGRQITLLNISIGGACFEITGAGELERHLTLRIAAHRLRCEIVWRDAKGRVGVRFLPSQLSEADLRRMVDNQQLPEEQA